VSVFKSEGHTSFVGYFGHLISCQKMVLATFLSALVMLPRSNNYVESRFINVQILESLLNGWAVLQYGMEVMSNLCGICRLICQRKAAS